MAFLSSPYGWPWVISRDAPPPPPESVRTYVRTLVRWRHNQILSAWWVTNFSYPWCFAGALRALKLRYDVKRVTVHCYPRNVDRCCPWSEVAGISAHFSKFPFVLFRLFNKSLNDWSLGNSEFCFPRISKTFSGNKIHCSPREQSLSVYCRFTYSPLVLCLCYGYFYPIFIPYWHDAFILGLFIPYFYLVYLLDLFLPYWLDAYILGSFIPYFLTCLLVRVIYTLLAWCLYIRVIYTLFLTCLLVRVIYTLLAWCLYIRVIYTLFLSGLHVGAIYTLFVPVQYSTV